MPRPFAAVLLATLALAGAPAGPATSRWHFTDFGRLHAIQQVRISPDSRRIIVSRLNVDVASGRGHPLFTSRSTSSPIRDRHSRATHRRET